MLRIVGVLALVTLSLSASHTKGTVGEGQLPPPGAPLIVRCGSTEYVQKCSDKSTVISEWSIMCWVLLWNFLAFSSSFLCAVGISSSPCTFIYLCQLCRDCGLVVYTILSLLLWLVSGLFQLALECDWFMNIFLKQLYCLTIKNSWHEWNILSYDMRGVINGCDVELPQENVKRSLQVQKCLERQE